MKAKNNKNEEITKKNDETGKKIEEQAKKNAEPEAENSEFNTKLDFQNKEEKMGEAKFSTENESSYWVFFEVFFFNLVNLPWLCKFVVLDTNKIIFIIDELINL